MKCFGKKKILKLFLMIIKIPCPGNLKVNGNSYSITMLNQYVLTWRLVTFLNQIYMKLLVQTYQTSEMKTLLMV